MIDSSIFQGKKAAYYTLGCKLNFSETSTFGKLLEEMGVSQAAAGEQAVVAGGTQGSVAGKSRVCEFVTER